MKPLRIFTPVFGKKHVNLLRRALAQSFKWPKNRDAIEDAKWCLFVHPSEFTEIVEIVTEVLPPNQIETIEAPETLQELTSQRGILMCRAFCQAIKKCLSDNSQMLISTADFIWSDGSITNMREKARQRDVCVSLPHPRALPSILDHLSKPKSSFELATLAIKDHPHKAWTSSQIGLNPNGSFKGGVLWRKMSPEIIALQHRMPSPYLLNLKPEDLKFFESDDENFIAAWGAIDHNWAMHLMGWDEKLQKIAYPQRWRMLLHSDLAFMAEVTDHDQNVPPQDPNNPPEPDRFWHDDFNFRMNRQFVATFRGDFG